jgi:small neutral amino acid transporter SnatA (MarC family)
LREGQSILTPLDFAITALVTLFVVVDPVGLVPTFLPSPRACRAARRARKSHRRRDPHRHRDPRRSFASRAQHFAVGLPGGLLLFAIAFEMVLGVRMRRKGQAAEEVVEEHVRNIAAFPLAIPLMAGPGAITATVLLHRPSNDLRPTSIIFEETEVSDGP